MCPFWPQIESSHFQKKNLTFPPLLSFLLRFTAASLKISILSCNKYSTRAMLFCSEWYSVYQLSPKLVRYKIPVSLHL